MEYGKPTSKPIEAIHRNHMQILSALDAERQYWFPHWRDVSDFFLPRRYPTLMPQQANQSNANRRNTRLLDSTSTRAIRTLASGMMNGVTSPSRAWFGLKLEGLDTDNLSQEAKLWLEDTVRRMQIVFAQSNFYTSIALLYLEWCCFGTASMSIEEDFDDIIRCFNHPLGEFYISQDASQRVNRHARRLMLKIEQVVGEFGIENVSTNTRIQYEKGGAGLLKSIEIAHIVEPNVSDALSRHNTPFREVYWEVGQVAGKYLAVRPVYEWKSITPRWELMGNDCYGTSPAMDALGDVQELQAIIRERAQGLQKQVRPPLIIDQQLQNRPKSLGAGGMTYASTSSSNFGAKVAYQVNLPFQELAMDIRNLQTSIRETCHNPLFNMISQLDTVRSATEIDSLREEKLIHLGPVLERFYNEGLDPILKRVYGIMQRNGLLMEAPPELAEAPIEVEYVSILTEAQRASGTVTIERFLQFTGGIAGIFPESVNIPNIDELMREYAEGIGISPKGLRTRDEVAEAANADSANQDLAQGAAVGKDLAAGAKVLSETDVGGGMNALQQLM